MDERQTHLVQSTLESVAPIADTAAALFYGRLFELEPSLRPLFSTDLRTQGRKFMDMLTLMVRALGERDQFIRVAQALGRRHAAYGARAEHYELMGSALLWTLKEGLGETFTPEVEEAWLAAYALLSTTMREGSTQNEGGGKAKKGHGAGPLSSEA